MQNLRVTIQTNTDLCSVLNCYETIFKYINLRTHFHGGCIGGAIFLNCLACGVFFLTTTSFVADSLLVSTLLKVTLVYTSLVFAIVTGLVGWPLIKTSFMLQEGFLSFLLERQLVIRSELANELNRDVFWVDDEEHDEDHKEGGDERRELGRRKREAAVKDFKGQLATLDAKILQLRGCPNHLKVLGIEATFASLGKLMAAVGCSLLSGLVRSAHPTKFA